MQGFASYRQEVCILKRAPKSKKSKLFLVTSPANGAGSKDAGFRTGKKIPESGIYRVIHRRHRVPHEVTLLRDEVFPRCAQCQAAVQFLLVRGIPSADEHESFTPIRLYELPVLESDESQKKAG